MQPTKQLLTDNRYQLKNKFNTTDKQLTVTDIEQVITKLPFTISNTFKYAVIGHIQFFGVNKVLKWAEVAATKNSPERYFMVILSRQRYK